MIDESSFEFADCGLKEQGLAVVGVFRADVDYPGEPEVGPVADSKETVAGQDFQKLSAFPVVELRAEAQARIGPNAAIRGLHPHSRIFLDEGLGGQEGRPVRSGKSAGAIKLASDGFVEKKIRSLKIVDELDDVEKSVARLRQDGLRSATQFRHKPRQVGNVSPKHMHGLPKELKQISLGGKFQEFVGEWRTSCQPC